MAGDITKPWRHFQNVATMRGAYFATGAGDHVIPGGCWFDTAGWDGTWMRAGGGSSSNANANANARNGTASSWIHITAYPAP